ncbi:hypothetical protein [Halorussus halophilus]|uniref:hypothetical protein n=1 Tax=Halorussus halophilus TaxID=2650975 RepID=UPI001300D116|nr:hypothetical protein [Halorussus halophilus]
MLRELSEGVTFRILIAIGLLIAVVGSALPDLRHGPANIWELVVDVGAIIGLVLILFSLWPPGYTSLTRIWERYHPYFAVGFAVFFLSWTLYLLSTGIDDLNMFILVLVVGLVYLIAFVRWYSSKDTAPST